MRFATIDLSMNNFLPYCKFKQDFTLIHRFLIKMNGKQGDASKISVNRGFAADAGESPNNNPARIENRQK